MRGDLQLGVLYGGWRRLVLTRGVLLLRDWDDRWAVGRGVGRPAPRHLHTARLGRAVRVQSVLLHHHAIPAALRDIVKVKIAVRAGEHQPVGEWRGGQQQQWRLLPGLAAEAGYCDDVGNPGRGDGDGGEGAGLVKGVGHLARQVTRTGRHRLAEVSHPAAALLPRPAPRPGPLLHRGLRGRLSRPGLALAQPEYVN